MGKRDLADGGGGKLLGTLANLHVGIDFSGQRVRASSQDLMPQKKKKKDHWIWKDWETALGLLLAWGLQSDHEGHIPALLLAGCQNLDKSTTKLCPFKVSLPKAPWLLANCQDRIWQK